jgi:hypothetical protein
MVKEIEETARNSTTIRLEKSTKRRVEKLGDLGDTWDTLLNDMAEFIEDHEEEWFTDEEEEK